MSGPDGVLDLPAIHAASSEIANLVLRDVRADLVDECRPDLLLGRLGELVEVERDVDPGKECFVKGFDAICGEEHDAAVVFKVAEAASEGEMSEWVDSRDNVYTYKTATMALRSRS